MCDPQFAEKVRRCFVCLGDFAGSSECKNVDQRERREEREREREREREEVERTESNETGSVGRSIDCSRS